MCFWSGRTCLQQLQAEAFFTWRWDLQAMFRRRFTAIHPPLRLCAVDYHSGELFQSGSKPAKNLGMKSLALGKHFFSKNVGHRTEDVRMSHAQLWPETETSRRWVSFQTSLNSRFESADRSSSDQSDYHERASIRIHPSLGFFFWEEISGRSCNQSQWCLHTNGMSPLSAVRWTRDWLAWASEECDQFDQVPLHRIS